ncbi:MAG TPA: glycosyltransferase [Chthoniobacterales bacterium]|nr:glycosyltransferase [Chthoniobacterales bacterium]
MDDDAPLVSVIVATYNWSSVLRYALLSVQAQTFAGFEVLVIGDHCTDDSAEVVASLGDARFRFENLEENNGHQSVANNRGLAMARGKWIAYLGHDDLWMPTHLDLLLRELERTNSDVAFTLAIVVGAPGCDGRRLFGAFDNGKYARGAHVPPSALIHRKSLADKCGNWPNHRVIADSPETVLLTRFFDQGAKFIPISEITVFKFPSSWRPRSYARRSCEEQADFFTRMQHQPDFLHRELIELALAQELFKPHTQMLPPSLEDSFLPGALIENFRRNRGLTIQAREEGPPRYVASPAMMRMVSVLCQEQLSHRQIGCFAMLELFYARDGGYSGLRHTQALVLIGRWTRLRIPLEHPSEGAPLRIDPCDHPAVIEIAWIALRRGRNIEWSARGESLDALQFGGDAFRIGVGRTLTARSRGNDPMMFLPPGVTAGPPLVLDCWIRLTRDE